MLTEGKRKLATIREISEIQPIPEADAIEVATVRGWKCVIEEFSLLFSGVWVKLHQI